MTGDLVAHNVWNETRLIQMKTVKTITRVITKYFPNVPIFPAIGNHEAVPTNRWVIVVCVIYWSTLEHLSVAAENKHSESCSKAHPQPHLKFNLIKD